MRIVLAMVVLVVGAGRGLAAEPAETQKTDTAVEQALKYLQSKQQEDGSWGKNRSWRPAITALCVLSFLSAGHEPSQGPYGESIDKGVRFLLKAQDKVGRFAPNEGTEMYHEGIAAWMLAELLKKADKEQAPALKAALERALEVIVKGQATQGQMKGGWRYRMHNPADGDMSITGWQIMALSAAGKAGVQVQRQTVDDALGFVRRCYNQDVGVFSYKPGTYPVVGSNASAVISLALEDRDGVKNETVNKAIRFLMTRVPRPGENHFYYSAYRSSHAVFLHNGDKADDFHKQLREKLLPVQEKDGRWVGQDYSGRSAGDEYCTALAVLTLTIDRQKLLVHQRLEKKE